MHTFNSVGLTFSFFMYATMQQLSGLTLQKHKKYSGVQHWAIEISAIHWFHCEKHLSIAANRIQFLSRTWKRTLRPWAVLKMTVSIPENSNELAIWKFWAVFPLPLLVIVAIPKDDHVYIFFFVVWVCKVECRTVT